MERTDAGYNAAEPTPRWRSLLDRARGAGRNSVSEDELTGAYSDQPPAQSGPREAQAYREPDYPSSGRYSELDQPYAYPEAYPAPTGRAQPPGYPPAGYASPPAYTPPPAYPPQPATYGTPSGYDRPNGQATVYGQRRDEPRPTEYRPQPPAPTDGLEDVLRILRADLGRPRVLAFANPKGGVHKTTATVLAAAAIGGVRGRGVLAWDDNELRGTLGLRAGSARHARTIRHLIGDLANIEASPSPAVLAQELDAYLRHASDGSYDVLAGEESPRFAQKLDPHTVRRVLELLRRTHEVICVDTGNNVESANWRTVLQMCDQLVITTVPREDAAFTADWMIDLLYDTGLGELAANAVTLLSCPTPNPSPLLNDLAKHFATRTRAVAIVPYDAALESGAAIDHTVLAPSTKRAWLQATGVMLDAFAR